MVSLDGDSPSWCLLWWLWLLECFSPTHLFYALSSQHEWPYPHPLHQDYPPTAVRMSISELTLLRFLINHLLGSEVIPVAAQPCTFTLWHLVLMEVCHGTPLAIFCTFSACYQLQWNNSSTLPCGYPCLPVYLAINIHLFPVWIRLVCFGNILNLLLCSCPPFWVVLCWLEPILYYFSEGQAIFSWFMIFICSHIQLVFKEIYQCQNADFSENI
jgi:hypothetical protein